MTTIQHNNLNKASISLQQTTDYKYTPRLVGCIAISWLLSRAAIVYFLEMKQLVNVKWDTWSGTMQCTIFRELGPDDIVFTNLYTASVIKIKFHPLSQFYKPPNNLYGN